MSDSSSCLCLLMLESTVSKLVVFFLPEPLAPGSVFLLKFGVAISSSKSKSVLFCALQNFKLVKCTIEVAVLHTLPLLLTH